MNTTKEKTSPVLLVSYALGEVGCQASWYMINSFLMVFYTDIVTLSAGAISMIMLVARIWDAINDPMMGSICDRTNSKWGRFRPYIFFAPPFLAIFNILTFTVFPVGGAAKVIICLITYILTGMAYTACSIAYQALQNVCAVDSTVRMNLATARGLGGSVAGFILGAVVPSGLLFFSSAAAKTAENPAPDAQGYFWFTVIISIVMVPIFWLCALGCKEKYTEQLHADTKQEKMGFFKAISEVVKNDQLLMVVLSTICGTICVSGRMGLLVYYIKDVVGDFTVIAKIFPLMSAFQFIGVLLLPLGVKALTKKGLLITLQMIMNIAFLGMFFFAHSGTMVVYVLSAICGLCNASASICPGLVGDSLEYGAWKLGRRQEGVAASLLSFGVKLSTAIAGSAGVLLLAAAGYDGTQMAQTASTQSGINAVVNIVPFIIGILSIVPMFFYKLSPAKVAEIRADLDAGKTAVDR